MPTAEEIAAASSTLTTSITADTATLIGWQDAARRAGDLDRIAAAIEAAGHLRVGLGGDGVLVSSPAFVANVVAKMRARATSIRDAVVLPPVEPVP